MGLFIEKWKQQTKNLKIEVYTLYLAYKDPRVPIYVKIFLACVVGYSLSPIDLIPDSIPILGYLDDLILIPLGVMLARKMISATVLTECREKSCELVEQGIPVNRIAAIVIILIWLLLSVVAFVFVLRFFRK